MNKYINIIFICILLSTIGCKREIIKKVFVPSDMDTTGVKLPEYIITNYGAKGDGNTDCSAIINNIIRDLPASGGTIVIPEGEFLLKEPIIINRNFVTIRGLNHGLRSNVDIDIANLNKPPGGGSKLVLGKGARMAISIPVLPDVNGHKNRLSGIMIKDLLISGGSNPHGIGINILQDNDGIRIENIIGINLSTGMFINAADAMIIKSCWISECQNSIHMVNGIQNTISNCQLGAQPGGITLEIDNQQNFNITGNQIYPDGDVNLKLNSCTYGNISSNNFQSYYIGMIEMDNCDNNIISSNLIWLRNPGDITRQLRNKDNDYGVIRIDGNYNLIANNLISCDWANPDNDPVTIRSFDGGNNTYQSIKVTDITSSRVFYVNENNQILNCVPSSNIFIDGDFSTVYIKY